MTEELEQEVQDGAEEVVEEQEPVEEVVDDTAEEAVAEDTDESNNWDEMYKELFGAPAAEERPTIEGEPKTEAEASELAELKKQVSEMSGMLREQVRKGQLEEACQKYEKAIPDWGEIREDVLALAKKYGNAMGDGDYIALARAKRAGLDKPRPVQKKVDTAKAASAARAGSEKPSGAGRNADRDYASVEDAAMDALRELKAKTK